MKKVWKLSVKYWSKSLSYISITQSIITQSRRKMSKLYTWNHYQETTEDDVNLLEERVPNLNSWPMCIYVFHIPRINQCPQSVLITLSWVFAYPSNKMEKCPQDTEASSKRDPTGQTGHNLSIKTMRGVSYNPLNKIGIWNTPDVTSPSPEGLRGCSCCLNHLSKATSKRGTKTVRASFTIHSPIYL